jgi:hypothetical protein
MIVINKLKQPLPTKGTIKFKEQLERGNLEYRSTLGMAADVASGLKPLDPDELMRHRKYEGDKWLARAPRWNGVDFPFAAYGEPGCAYELPERIGNFLVQKYNAGVPLIMEQEGDEILHVLRADEKLPDGVVAIRMNIEDPLLYSSEALLSRGKVVSSGYAEPPPLAKPEDLAVPVTAMVVEANAHAAAVRASKV